MAGKKSGYEMMMENARAGAKGKGRAPATSAAKAKEAAVKEAIKEIVKERMDVDGGKVATSLAESVALLTKKETEFDPMAAAFWKPGEHVPFTFLASAFDSE